MSTIDDYPNKLLIFGTQGGFANASAEFRIYENGQFEKYEARSQSITPYQNLDKRNCEQIFKNFYDLGLAQMDIDAPGNMSYFIKMKEGDSVTKLLWGSIDEPAPSIVKQYYKVLQQFAKKSKNLE